MTDRERFTDDQKQLSAEIHASDCGCIEVPTEGVCDDYFVELADTVLASTWLAAHDRALRVATLEAAADAYEAEYGQALVVNVRRIPSWLRRRAAGFESTPTGHQDNQPVSTT